MTEPLFPALDGRHGDHPRAVVVDGVPTSWADLADRAHALGTSFGGAAAVAVDATPTLDTVVTVLAGLASGVPVVPVPPDSGPGERAHILRDSGAALVVGDPDWADCALPRVPVPAGGNGVRLPEPAADAPALVVYTSGTTGAPKGALMPRRAIAACLDGLADAWAWTPDDVLVHGLPLFHVHGLVLGTLGALRVGSRLVHTGRPLASRYAAARADGGSLYFGVPTVWHRLCAEPESARALTGARLLVSGSAPLPVPVFGDLHALTGHLPVERYGMTETLITVSTRADGERRPGWVGVPIRGVRTRVVGDDGAEVGPGEIGELQVAGDTLFLGYLNRPEATASSMDGEWFRTGDAAEIDGEGFHRIVGRQSIDIIKTGGFKVGAGEIETVLLGHAAVGEVAVVGVPDDDLGQRIVAYVVPAPGHTTLIPTDELVALVASQLNAHKRPREVRIVESLPRNAMGKVQKTLLMS